jgi:hypothetical protein
VRSRLALAVVLVLVVPASGARAEVPARSVQAPAAGDLFVLTAAGGKLERVRGRNRLFRLVLHRPARDVTGFSDRPARTTGQQPLARFVGRWASLGFAEVPPNAAVVLAEAPSDRDVLVVELSRPRLGARGRTLAFRAELLRGNPGGRLRGFARRADRRSAARFGRVSLFIDPGGQEVGLLFTLSNVPSGGLASIAFSNAVIDLSGDLFVNADGPARFTAAPAGFVLAASGSSPVNASVQVATTVVAGADCALVTAILTAGTSATVRVSSTSRTLPVMNGRLCIPFR